MRISRELLDDVVAHAREDAPNECCGMIASRDTAKEWTKSSGFTRKVGLYLLHPELGGDQLAMAGSDPLTQTWAREHHKPPDQWTLDHHVAEVLKAADGD